MRERVCYRIVFKLNSALSIGAADNDRTDHDVVLDSRGKPLLPGTSLAGLYRSHFDEVRAIEVFGEVYEEKRNQILKDLPKDEREKLLGEDGHRCDESAVAVYDGEWADGNATVTTRDSVALRDKVAVDKLKFDRQVVQAGAIFVTHIEILDTQRCQTYDIEEVLSAIHAGELRLGAKKTRGYGRLEVLACLRRSFGTNDVEKWLEFDLFANEGENSWRLAEDTAGDITEEIRSGYTPRGIDLRLKLQLCGGVSIREYSTEPSGDDGASPDYRQMVVHGVLDDKGNRIPVIPGTSWCGALRDRYEQFAGTDRTRALFGYADEGKGDDSKRISRLSFDNEYEITGGQWRRITRNAIDPFTGGTVQGALYTEETYYGGTTDLILRVSNTEGLDESHYAPLVCVLADLHNGFLAVGGLTAVGRGLFRIREAELLVDGKQRDGFKEALLSSPAGFEGLVVPDVEDVSKMFCTRGGEEQ